MSLNRVDKIKRAADRMLWRDLEGASARPVTTLRVKWPGDEPLQPGDWLRSDSPTARTAYWVIEIPRGLSATEHRPVVCERYRIDEIPLEATVYGMSYDRRKNRRK